MPSAISQAETPASLMAPATPWEAPLLLVGKLGLYINSCNCKRVIDKNINVRYRC